MVLTLGVVAALDRRLSLGGRGGGVVSVNIAGAHPVVGADDPRVDRARRGAGRRACTCCRGDGACSGRVEVRSRRLGSTAAHTARTRSRPVSRSVFGGAALGSGGAGSRTGWAAGRDNSPARGSCHRASCRPRRRSSARGPPSIDVAAWRLSVGATSFSLAGPSGTRPGDELRATLNCTSGSTSWGRGRGWRLGSVLDAGGIGRQVAWRSAR